MKRPISNILLLFLLLIQAIGAIPAGYSLVIDPSGEGIGLPISLLDTAPFSDFLIPGIFLLFILGLIPLFLIYGLITKKNWPWIAKINPDKGYHWSLIYSHYFGIVLILWITMQLYFGIGFHMLHFSYTFLGVFVVFLANLPATRRTYLNDQQPYS